MHGAQLAVGGDALTKAAEAVVLAAATRPRTGDELLAGLADALALPGSRIIAACLPPGVPPEGLANAVGRHILVGIAPDTDPAELIGEIARSTMHTDQASTRRLTSPQRSLTQAPAAARPARTSTPRRPSTWPPRSPRPPPSA